LANHDVLKVDNARWTTAVMTQSTTWPGAECQYKLTISPNVLVDGAETLVKISSVGLVDSNFSSWICSQPRSGMCTVRAEDLNKCNEVPDNLPIPGLSSEFSWPPEDGLFQITFRTPHFVAGCTYEIIFSMFNPITAQSGIQLKIELSYYAPLISASVEGRFFIVDQPTLIEHRIAQSNGYPDSSNSIHVAFSSNIKLPKGSTFSLLGLESVTGIVMGAETRLRPPGTSMLESRLHAGGSFGGTLPMFGPCSGQSCGVWNATMPGVLHLAVFTDLLPATLYGFSFDFKNPTKKQRAPDIYLQLSSIVLNQKVLMSSSNTTLYNSQSVLLGTARPLEVLDAQFVLRNSSQNSSFPSEACMLRFSVASSVGLTRASGMIQINGLIGFSPKTSTIPVTVGRGIRVFTSSSGGNSGFASFDFNWKTLNFYVESLLAGDALTLEINHLNPSVKQSSPRLSITLNSTSWDVANEIASSFSVPTQIDLQPLFVREPIFLVHVISQQTSAPGASNKIRIAFSTNVYMSPESQPAFTISGLHGNPQLQLSDLSTEAFVVQLTDESLDQSDSQRVFRASVSDPASSGLFSSANGVLLLQAHQVIPGTIYNFSFIVKNPLLPIPLGPVFFSASRILLPPLRIESDTTVTNCSRISCSPAQIHRSSANSQPLPNYAAAMQITPSFFVTSEIQQASPYPYTSNELLISFSTNIALRAGATLTLSGLSGMSSSSNNQLPVQGLGDASGVFLSFGRWNSFSGNLIFTLAADSLEFTMYILKFSLVNPGVGQHYTANQYFISCSGRSSNLDPQLVSKTALNSPAVSTMDQQLPLQVTRKQ
jgi:hypothetical protein